MKPEMGSGDMSKQAFTAEKLKQVSPEHQERIRELSDQFALALTAAIGRLERDDEASKERPTEIPSLLAAADRFSEQLGRTANFGSSLKAPPAHKVEDLTATLLGAGMLLERNDDNGARTEIKSAGVPFLSKFIRDVQTRLGSRDATAKTTKLSNMIVQKD